MNSLLGKLGGTPSGVQDIREDLRAQAVASGALTPQRVEKLQYDTELSKALSAAQGHEPHRKASEGMPKRTGGLPGYNSRRDYSVRPR